MAQKISQMTEQTTASMTEAGTSDFLGGYTATGGNANRKFSLAGLANYFLNKFKMTLGGSSQTVKSAIDALNSNLYHTKITSGGISNGASETINLGNGTRGTILCASVSGTGRFIIGYGSNSSGAVDYSVIAGNLGTSVISANTGEISITNNSGAYITWTMITNT